ncbi:dihydropteroate synthase [Viridibacterium curvum]|uniref:dihydropteroate synthase n=1 Tax=Viridibacterium curvum TaxID=1101404 RepID=A0ABP9QXI6_9RHOO
MSNIFHCGRFRLSLDKPLIMAILNVTPDSFSGDGLLGRRDQCLAQAELALREGAALLDIGGESSRPGAASVSLQEEMDRVLPIVEALRDCGVPLSIDTVKPELMSAAIRAGASLINDINALRAEGALEAVVATDVGVCVMHMQGEPRTMQAAPAYDDAVNEVEAFLRQQSERLHAAGVARERILLDPGFGFGKRFAHNQSLFRALPRLAALGPLLVGVSRKTMLGDIVGRPAPERVAASAAAALLAAQKGAAVLRVHDVAATRDALAVLEQLD